MYRCQKAVCLAPLPQIVCTQSEWCLLQLPQPSLEKSHTSGEICLTAHLSNGKKSLKLILLGQMHYFQYGRPSPSLPLHRYFPHRRAFLNDQTPSSSKPNYHYLQSLFCMQSEQLKSLYNRSGRSAMASGEIWKH